MRMGTSVGVLEKGLVRLPLARLKWVAILGPAAFIAAYEYASHFQFHTLIVHEERLYLVTVAVIGLSAGVFSHILFGILERMQRELLRRNEELAARTEALTALHEIGMEISTLLEPEKLMASIVTKAQRLLGTDTSGLALTDENGDTTWRFSTDGPGQRLKQVALTDHDKRTGSLPALAAPWIMEDTASAGAAPPDVAHYLASEDLKSAVLAPVRIGDKALGALLVANREPTHFDLGQVRLLESLANQVAVAIENAKLYEQSQQWAVLEERERIAREMHDGLAQILGYIAAKTKGVKELWAAGKTAEAQVRLTEIEKAVQESYADVRECILGLKTVIAPARGLIPSLTEFLQRFSLQGRLKAELVVRSDSAVKELSPKEEVQLIRIIQEALTNVRKHSGASMAQVEFDRHEDWAWVTIRDNGKGFDPSRAASRIGLRFGLQTMRERAESVGGTLEVRSQPGEGTEVVVGVPLNHE